MADSSQRQAPGQALELIRRFEGCVLSPYRDQAGRLTVGIGHLVRPYERFGFITTEKAYELLREDLAHAQDDVRRLVRAELNDNQYSALLSFVFNLGGENLRTSTLLAKLNRGDYEGAAGEFPRWNKVRDPRFGRPVVSEGLTARREAERELFLTAA